MARRQIKFNTAGQLDKLNKIKDILNELNDYKPLTLRQIYYQMVGKGFIENSVSQYTMLSGLIKWARISGEIEWSDIEDRVRAFHDLTGWNNNDDFIQAHLRSFLQGYKRDLIQSQEKYIEIWIEKDALSSIFIKACRSYTIPVIVCRGFSSISFLNDFRKRLEYQSGRESVMLYFGDFDPSGLEMLESMKITLRDELNLSGIEFKRIALLKNDIKKYNLPNDPDALKKTDTRYKKFLDQYGAYAVELDALSPDVLTRKIKRAIENEINMDLFNQEKEKQEKELDKLNILRDDITDFIKGR